MGSSVATSRTTRKASLATALLLAAAAIPSRASADDATPAVSPSDTEAQTQAQAAMERGIAAFGKGDAATALYEYERAMRLVPRANLPYRYAAEALLQLDRPRAAIEYLEKYLAMNNHVSDAAVVRARIDSLRRERLPGTLKLTCAVAGTLVRVDQGPLRPLPLELELSPGEHVFVVEHPGHMTTTERTQVVGGRSEQLTLTVGAPVTKASGDGDAPAGSSTALMVTSFVTLGVGALALGTSGVMDASVLRGKIADLDAASLRGDANLAGLKSDASSVRTGVVAGYVAGTIVTVAGAVLLVAWQLGKAKDPAKVGFGSPFVATF